MKGNSQQPSSATFSGVVAHSFTASRGRYREFFEWCERPKNGHSDIRFSGDELVDVCEFGDAQKLGPAVLYKRPLPTTDEEQLREFFLGNRVVVYDSRQRARPGRNEVVASEADLRRGFAQMYPPEFIERSWGGADEVWDEAAAVGYKWYVARAAVVDSGQAFEVLCWVGASFRDLDEVILAKVSKFLQGHDGVRMVDGLVELFDTHYRRPLLGMMVFEIDRRSKSNEEEYFERFVWPYRDIVAGE